MRDYAEQAPYNAESPLKAWLMVGANLSKPHTRKKILLLVKMKALGASLSERERNCNPSPQELELPNKCACKVYQTRIGLYVNLVQS